MSFTAPETDGTYYLTAYMPKAEIKDNYATPIVLSILPVTVDVNAVEEAELTLSGLHDAQVKYLKLYTYIDGVKGDTDLLADVTIANAAYTLTLPVGDYWVEGYDANDDCNGGLSLTVKAGENTAKIQRIYQISVNSGWVLGTDYTLDVKVTSADNQVRTAAPGQTVSGKGQTWEKTYDSCIFVVGDTVQATVTPDPEEDPHHERQSFRQLQGWRERYIQRAGELYHHGGYTDQLLRVLLHRAHECRWQYIPSG